MPKDIGDHDEVDTTVDEFDAMWASATPVETLASVAVNTPGQSFWLSGLTLMPANDAAGRPGRALLSTPTMVPDTTPPTSRAAGPNVHQPA
ncbi:hypothetical protein MyChFU_31390 [Mycobacterium intracellulare subsp. chimaera]